MSTPVLIASGLTELLPMQRSGDPSSHISAIIRSLCVALGHFEVDPDEDLAKRQTRFELGSAFENAVIAGLVRRVELEYPDRFVLVGEVSKDGLIGSPDLVDVATPAVVEVKLTWLSSNQDPEGTKFWKYWVQLMAYCYMLEIQVGQLHVCHVMGNYRDDRDPTYNVWERKFDMYELADNWRMLTRHGRKMVR